MFVCWPVITMLYYGLSMSADKINMTENVYLSYILVTLIEIPSYLILPLIIDKWGRKPLFFVTQFIPGVCCIAAAFLTSGTAFFAILVLSAKFLVSAAFNVTFMFTAELYPTAIRNTAIGICSTGLDLDFLEHFLDLFSSGEGWRRSGSHHRQVPH